MKARGVVLVVTVLAAAAGACAPKAPPPVLAPAVPKHPEFVFPSIETTLAPAVAQELQSAWNLLQAGDVRAAERRYAAVLKGPARPPAAHTGLGYAALAAREYEDAIEHFDRALAARAGYAPALAGRGQTYLAMGDRERALASFDAALAADSSLTTIRSAADVLRVQTLQGDVAGARRAAQEGRLDAARSAYQQAIQASPQSPFLYRELGEVERRAGNLVAALEHAQKAMSLEPGEPRNYILAGDIHEAMGDYTRAADALATAATLDPSEALADRIEALRARVSFEAMPEEFKAIGDAETITRAQLAALIGVHLEPLVKRAPRTTTTVITDTRGNWAQPWILAVTRAGFMEVYPNHTFQPRTVVRRADLASAASRILALLAAENPGRAAAWKTQAPRLADVPTGHLAYPAVTLAVGAGIIKPLESGAFGLTRPVTGAEALAAVNRLQELAASAQPARSPRR